MNNRFPRIKIFTAWIFLLATFCAALHAQTNYSAVTDDGRGAIATVNPKATTAALAAYHQGGNAIDAAVAAALTLGVVDGYNSGIGGGCFILVRWADGQIEAIDGREMAPAAADRDMYLRDGIVDASLSKTGALAIGIPGSLLAYDYLINKGGQLSLADSLSAGTDLAEKGFKVDTLYTHRLNRASAAIKQFPATAKIFLNEQGNTLVPGERLIQSDLAYTYRKIAAQGVDYFYQGEFATKLASWMQKNGGIITRQDFSNYRLQFRHPLLTRYRGYTLVGYPPPSSGGIHVAQILNMLEQFDINKLSDVDRHHLLAEAMKLAFADRAYWLGDSDFVNVPKGLIDPEYAKSLASKINMQKANSVPQQGLPPNAETDFFGKHTTHIAAADKEGNWVAITTTVNTSFGSKVVIPGTGVILNNQMDDFSIQPGTPNAFGLVGVEANSIQPGKRPLSSMSPTIVLKDNKPVLTLGAAGGPTIITQVVQALVNTIDLCMELPEALAAVRVHHQWKPDVLLTEGTMPQEEQEELSRRGHQIKIRDYLGATQAISLNGMGEFIAASEPRIQEKNNSEE
ncbi:MAG: gamma-glutamyltransferase [Pseudomonadales bacterium]|nr:gamma-glutamyltransferase [Pseudomonadales bacterium]